MVKYGIATSIISVCILLGCAPDLHAQQSGNLRLTGTVNPASTEWVYLQSFHDKLFKTIDSAKVHAGKFSFNSSVTLPELYGLSVDTTRNPYYVFLQEGSVEVSLDTAEHYNRSTVSGSTEHDLFMAYRKLEHPDIRTFIKAHPSSIAAAYVLYRYWSHRLPPEELGAAIGLLDPSLHQTPYVETLKALINVLDEVAVGRKAPDFEALDPEGKPIRLYERLKRYTLIDFWASWCVPCRKENPNIVQQYEKYKDAGFSVFGVSLDKSRDAWRKAIEHDGLHWDQVSELKYWDSDIARAYGVRAIPANFLVDEYGTIVAKNLKGEALGNKLEELLGAEGNRFRGQAPITESQTNTRAVLRQWKGIFADSANGVFFGNDFDGARLNGMAAQPDGTYQLLVAPENTPINESPWYAFRVWSAKKKRVRFALTYLGGYSHRYTPKFSKDRINWMELTPTGSDTVESGSPYYELDPGTDTLWVAAQPLATSSDVQAWLSKLCTDHQSVERVIVGQSSLGKPITGIAFGNKRSKRCILILGRQHPPEVTGHTALKTVVETLLGDQPLQERFLDSIRVVVLPLLNPDGVDGGFWRHNNGGVDLNRDWANFDQHETQAVRDFLKTELGNEKKLLVAIDFHSTYEDIFYTVDPSREGNVPGLVPQWLETLKKTIPRYDPLIKPLYTAPPTYTAFSYLFETYGAESLVFEIGDRSAETATISKSKTAAIILMELLLKRL